MAPILLSNTTNLATLLTSQMDEARPSSLSIQPSDILSFLVEQTHKTATHKFSATETENGGDFWFILVMVLITLIGILAGVTILWCHGELNGKFAMLKDLENTPARDLPERIKRWKEFLAGGILPDERDEPNFERWAASLVKDLVLKGCLDGPDPPGYSKLNSLGRKEI